MKLILLAVALFSLAAFAEDGVRGVAVRGISFQSGSDPKLSKYQLGAMMTVDMDVQVPAGTKAGDVVVHIPPDATARAALDRIDPILGKGKGYETTPVRLRVSLARPNAAEATETVRVRTEVPVVNGVFRLSTQGPYKLRFEIARSEVFDVEIDQVADRLRAIPVSGKVMKGALLDPKETTFILPDNDGEARTMGDLLRRIGAPDIRVSKQAWGARLDKEPEAALQGLKHTVVVAEMPSPEVEAKLRAAGHEVVVIDHHDYGDLKRANPKSSIEQLADRLGVGLGRFEQAVAINDRGYIFGLIDSPLRFSPEEIRRVREHDLSSQGYQESDFAECRKALANKVVAGDVTIVAMEGSKTGYLSDLFTLEDPKKVRNLLIVCHKDGVPYEVNFYGDPKRAQALKDALGGWAGGDPSRSMYWGLSGTIDVHKLAATAGLKEVAVRDGMPHAVSAVAACPADVRKLAGG